MDTGLSKVCAFDAGHEGKGGRWNIKSARRGLGDDCVGCWQGSDGKTEM